MTGGTPGAITRARPSERTLEAIYISFGETLNIIGRHNLSSAEHAVKPKAKHIR